MPGTTLFMDGEPLLAQIQALATVGADAAAGGRTCVGFDRCR